MAKVTAARHTDQTGRIARKLDTLLGIAAAAVTVAIALVAGIFIGITIGVAPERPDVIRVVVQPEPQAIDRKAEERAQADAEVAAFNRGLAAGKVAGCNLDTLEARQ